jgi:hypothetical protein
LQLVDWQTLLMHPSVEEQQVLPAVQLAPDATQAQQAFPHGCVPPMQTASGPRQVEVERSAQATPALQQACPHGVVLAGQPQMPWLAFRQAMPALQQHGPHGVLPGAHGAALATVGPEQVTPASDRKGLRMLAAVAPAAAAPSILRTLRRV